MRIFAIVIAILIVVVPAIAHPTVDGTTIAAFVGKPLTIKGAGFGKPDSSGRLVLAQGLDTEYIPATSDEIESWTNQEIVVRLPHSAKSGKFRVETALGKSPDIGIEVYRYEWFDIPPTAGTNAMPLAIARTADGTLWVNQEFHLELQRFNPVTERVNGIPIPHPAAPGPFAMSILGADIRTEISGAGEDIIVDDGGRVWFTQGGGYLYEGRHPNHSRVVRYDPRASEGNRFRVYNVPGDDNEVIGLAWDARRGRIWFTEGGLHQEPKIVSFDPERVPWDNTFNFSRSLDQQICRAGGPYDTCFHIYKLPEGSRQPAHLAFDRDGQLWYTAFWGNRIGRLDPKSGTVIEYPLPKTNSTAKPAQVLGSGPWQIVVAPNGDIVFNTHFDATIYRISIDRANDGSCRALDAGGDNPCLHKTSDSGIDTAKDFMHSIAFNTDGRLWFTEHGPEQGSTAASLGFVTSDWKEIVRLPPLAVFAGNGNPAAAGLVIDPATGDIWFCEFWRHRIGHLQRVY